MITHLKSYLEYKESKLPWLKQVPRHWKALPVKQEFDIQLGKMLQNAPQSSADSFVPYLKSQHVQWAGVKTGDLPRMWASRREVAQFGVKPGDLLVCEGGEGGRCAVLKSICPEAIIQNALHRARPRGDGDNYFLAYAMAAIASVGWFEAINNKATIAHFTRDKFGSLGIPLPPPSEQAAIVRFLDWANGRLERAMRAKRKVIALLNEQKQAIIHRAVTRGLDPSAPLKPSGIPWLGDIPRHWDVRPLKAVCEIQSGMTLGKDYAGKTTYEYPYLRVANVQAGHANLAVVKTMRVTRPEALRCMLQRGDVLMTEGGDPDKLGRGCVWDSQVAPCLHQNHVFAVRPNQSKLEPHFLSALMGTSYARAYFQSTAKQTTNLASTNKTKIGQFEVLLPKVHEQQIILTAVGEETRPVNTAISRLNREIELLREYRTRLVADVVTGKLDVREAAARLPDEAPLETAEDDTDLSDEPEAADEEATV